MPLQIIREALAVEALGCDGFGDDIYQVRCSLDEKITGILPPGRHLTPRNASLAAPGGEIQSFIQVFDGHVLVVGCYMAVFPPDSNQHQGAAPRQKMTSHIKPPTPIWIMKRPSGRSGMKVPPTARAASPSKTATRHRRIRVVGLQESRMART